MTAYAGLAALFLFAALATRRPELAVVAAPFALLPALGLALARPPAVRLWFTVERPTALEQDELELELVVASERPVERLELLLVLPEGLEIVSGGPALSLRLGWEEERTIALRLRCVRWGNYNLGEIRLRARDRLGLLTWESRLDRRTRLRVYPLPETLRAIVAPVSTQPFAGNQVARQKGEGLEFADLREFAAGDRVRSINWRASARRNELVVNERHPERNADVILFLDTFADARAGGRSTLDLAVRATATLASRYLERRDRVGLVSFGGILRWLTPGTGTSQRYRIVDALLESEIVFNYAWKDVSVIPSRTLPPQALVVAISPLLDDRAVEALADLRARRYDLAIVEVDPAGFATPGESESDRLAHRLWLLRREEIRARYERLGVAVATWSDDEPLDSVLEGVRAFRRHARLARA
ncbi:MAG TPA: DUF58 domain-containing protein [Gaiellaceae bacterium]|nr:DUF58 domain-containing protein [Gaiellaceae bacterium]